MTNEPEIGLISLGCPKALVDSERILTSLINHGYKIKTNHANADLVIVNTCGFIDSAKEESLKTINAALKTNGKVIVTGCLGANRKTISKSCPKVLAITGPSETNKVLRAVQKTFPKTNKPLRNFLSPSGVKLTPKHYSYLKISEGCNHKCRFCIIPDLRGKLKSLRIDQILVEAENLVKAGTKELLVISQDTSAYGLDLRSDHQPEKQSNIFALCEALGNLGVWIRLHYLYPYPHLSKIIPLMAQRKVLPYLDVPFQHSHPDVLKRMRRPAQNNNSINLIKSWRKDEPEIAIRSTFIVGYPGETEVEFQHLLDWMGEVKLDRVGCFKYNNVRGAKANELPGHIDDETKQDRWDRFMTKAQQLSEAKLQTKIGTVQTVIVDEVDADGAVCRTMADAPEIDGNLFIDRNFSQLKPGQILNVKVDESNEYDLWGSPVH